MMCKSVNQLVQPLPRYIIERVPVFCSLCVYYALLPPFSRRLSISLSDKMISTAIDHNIFSISYVHQVDYSSDTIKTKPTFIQLILVLDEKNTSHALLEAQKREIEMILRNLAAFIVQHKKYAKRIQQIRCILEISS